MIAGTVVLTKGATESDSVVLIGPVDAPYDVVLDLIYSHDGSGAAVSGSSFSLTSDPSNGGAWYALKGPAPARVTLRLQEGDSLNAATWDSGAGAVVSFIGNPAC